MSTKNLSPQTMTAVCILDDLYLERQMINEAIYHIRRYILRMNYKKTKKLIASARSLNQRSS